MKIFLSIISTIILVSVICILVFLDKKDSVEVGVEPSTNYCIAQSERENKSIHISATTTTITLNMIPPTQDKIDIICIHKETR